MQPNNNETLGA